MGRGVPRPPLPSETLLSPVIRGRQSRDLAGANGEPPWASRRCPYLLSVEWVGAFLVRPPTKRNAPRPVIRGAKSRELAGANGEPPWACRRCPYLLSVEHGRGERPRPPANQAKRSSPRHPGASVESARGSERRAAVGKSAMSVLTFGRTW